MGRGLPQNDLGCCAAAGGDEAAATTSCRNESCPALRHKVVTMCVDDYIAACTLYNQKGFGTHRC